MLVVSLHIFYPYIVFVVSLSLSLSLCVCMCACTYRSRYYRIVLVLLDAVQFHSPSSCAIHSSLIHHRPCTPLTHSFIHSLTHSLVDSLPHTHCWPCAQSHTKRLMRLCPTSGSEAPKQHTIDNGNGVLASHMLCVQPSRLIWHSRPNWCISSCECSIGTQEIYCLHCHGSLRLSSKLSSSMGRY
jgi:hypothetical protein